VSGALWVDLLLLALLAVVLLALSRLPALEAALARVASGGRPSRREGEEEEREEDTAPGPVGYFQRLARQSGYHPEALLWIYWVAKIALALLLPLAAYQLWARWGGRPAWFVPTGLLVLGFFAPDLWLLAVRRARRKRVRNGLSFFLDLIVSLLHSGLGLEEAFRRAARDGLVPGHPLALEAGLVDLELGAGKERGQAFESMALRTGVKELRSVAAALRLGMRLGNPVQDTLSAQADLLRTRRREDARRELSLAPLKTLLPILLCGFPIFLVLVIFPALVEISELLGEMQDLFSRL
jgi:Flp pilus assembly protein TadB